MINKRQSQVSKEGKKKELEVKNILLSDSFIRNNFLVDNPSKVLRNKDELYISYGSYKTEIDADLCVVDKHSKKLFCVISVKKSLRERGAQTAYWALKIREAKKRFKYIFCTPDVNKELFDPENPNKKRKWRIILPHECDSVFVYSYEGKVFKEKNFYVGKKYLIEYIKHIKP